MCGSTYIYGCIILAFVSMNFFDVGGLILLKPDYGAPLQFAATAAFLSKLFSDYLDLMRSTGRRCGSVAISQNTLRSFSMSQATSRYHDIKSTPFTSINRLYCFYFILYYFRFLTY